MSLSLEDINKIAHLARLNLSPADLESFPSQLSQILDFVAQMEKVSTDAVEPLAHPQALAQRLRPDVVIEDNLREKYQQIAPAVTAGLYLVPKVIDEA